MADETDNLGWTSISDLARAIGRDKGGVSRRVSRLEVQGLLKTRVGESGQKLVNAAEFHRVAGETVDAVRESNGMAAAARAAEHAASSDPVLSRQQARRAAYDADLKRLDLDERRGLLVRVAKVEDALAAAGEKIVRIIDQLPMDADDLATAVAKGGVQALRLALKEIARRMRTGIADSLSLGDD